MYKDKIIREAKITAPISSIEPGKRFSLSDNPKVSIGIPCYNRFQKLSRTLKSVQNQTYKNLEIIVSDNASSDIKIEKMMVDAAENDKRIKYFRQPKNQGNEFNFAFVLNQAIGEYFMWLCDDDWLSSNYIEKCLETLISGPAIIRRARERLEEGVVSLVSKMVNGDLTKITPELVAEAARKGDKLAFNIMEKTGEYLGIGIANTVNLFNPELVIIGAGISRAGDLFLDTVKRTVKARALHTASTSVDIKLSELGHTIAAQGAAILVLKNIFK